jgi:hypothetical protein
MRDLPRCAHCGSPVLVARQGSARDPASPLDSLYQEVRRIREIAEAGRDESESRLRIEELTREVNELRATVARLRGSALAGLAGPAGRHAPAA